MISGRFRDIGELFFEIDVIAADGESFPVEVLLDTGFTTGWLAMDIQDIESLGWLLIKRMSEKYQSVMLNVVKHPSMTAPTLDPSFRFAPLRMTITTFQTSSKPRQAMQTARGEEFFRLYAGKVIVDEQEFTIPVVAAIGIPDNLLGLQWLKTKRLVVDFPSGLLTLGEN